MNPSGDDRCTLQETGTQVVEVPCRRADKLLMRHQSPLSRKNGPHVILGDRAETKRE